MPDLTMPVADAVSARLSEVVVFMRSAAQSMIRNVAPAMVTEVFTPVWGEPQNTRMLAWIRHQPGYPLHRSSNANELPLIGVVLNGVTTVIYGSVPAYAAPERRTHALSVFYTIAIGAAAVAPPFAGFIGDFIGIPDTVMIVSALTLATIPFAFLLKDPCLGEQRTKYRALREARRNRAPNHS
jgi:hypothetical protein